MEQALGSLINAMNPYSNPACEHVDNVEGWMQPLVVGRPLPEGVVAETRAAVISQLDVEIDNYQGSEWGFMGQMYKIKRALLIPYRYEVRNKDGNKSGVWATAYLLVGYVGGDGGG